MKFSKRLDIIRKVENWFKTENEKTDSISINKNVAGIITVLEILGYLQQSYPLKCSVCGKKYSKENWSNAWRCSNCF